jgi:hypothetical protein
MKKTILSFYQSTFSKSLLTSVVMGLLFMQPVTAMPSVNGFDHITYIEASPEKLRAVSYIMQNSQVMKVHLENPAKEKITIQILNSHKEIVYQEHLSNREGFIGKYNLQELPNGRYTFIIKSASQTYSTAFSVETFTKREVNILENDVKESKEDLRNIAVFQQR